MLLRLTCQASRNRRMTVHCEHFAKSDMRQRSLGWHIACAEPAGVFWAASDDHPELGK